VPAVSPESFKQAYQEIGALLRVPGIADAKANVKRLIKAKLSDESFEQWLMIVNNTNNVGVLFNPPKEASNTNWLMDYLPHSRKGSILFTTRTQIATINLAGSNVMELSELSKREAKEVLEKRLLQKESLKDNEVVHQFLEILTLLPLAIVQAVAFINENSISLSKYILIFRSSERDATDLLSEEFKDQGRYRDMKNPVVTTCYISFEQIRKHDGLAAEYLSFMACTTGESIPASLLLPSRSRLERTKATGILKAYAFITERQPQKGRREQVQEYVEVFDVHALVRLATRSWLRENDRWRSSVDKALTRLVEVVPLGGHDKREVWTAYLPHAIHAVGLPEMYEAEARISLLDRIGRCEQTLGRYKAAEWAHRQLLERRERVLGKEHLDTLTSINNIARALSNQGKYMEAEKIY
jgi:hypothetical protein